MTLISIWFGFLSFVLGSAAGSAMTCLGDRLAEGKSWIKGKSICGVCGHDLHAADLIPVVSWFSHHGRCRYCGAKLPKKYIWTELTCGLIFVLCYMKEGMNPVKLIYEWSICASLLALSVTDLDCFIIPDRFILFLFAWRFLYLLHGWQKGWMSSALAMDDLLGAVVPSGLILIVSLIMDRTLKKETMGGGDIKLLSALGFHAGIAGSLMLVMTSCLAGLLMALVWKKEKIAFGPAISLAFVIVMLYGNEVIAWYAGLAR